jgi:hypothetical protein
MGESSTACSTTKAFRKQLNFRMLHPPAGHKESQVLIMVRSALLAIVVGAIVGLPLDSFASHDTLTASCYAGGIRRPAKVLPRGVVSIVSGSVSLPVKTNAPLLSAGTIFAMHMSLCKGRCCCFSQNWKYVSKHVAAWWGLQVRRRPDREERFDRTATAGWRGLFLCATSPPPRHRILSFTHGRVHFRSIFIRGKG